MPWLPPVPILRRGALLTGPSCRYRIALFAQDCSDGGKRGKIPVDFLLLCIPLAGWLHRIKSAGRLPWNRCDAPAPLRPAARFGADFATCLCNDVALPCILQSCVSSMLAEFFADGTLRTVGCRPLQRCCKSKVAGGTHCAQPDPHPCGGAANRKWRTYAEPIRLCGWILPPSVPVASA